MGRKRKNHTLSNRYRDRFVSVRREDITSLAKVSKKGFFLDSFI